MNVVDGVYMSQARCLCFLAMDPSLYCRSGGEEDIADASGSGHIISRASSLQYGRQKDTSSSLRTGHVEGSIEQDGKGVATMCRCRP